MVFIKGFTPIIFDLLPFTVWKVVAIGIHIYRMIVLPFWLRLTGYGRYADWDSPQIGSLQPKADDDASQISYDNIVKGKALVDQSPFSSMFQISICAILIRQIKFKETVGPVQARPTVRPALLDVLRRPLI